MGKDYRVILASGFTVEISAIYVESLKSLIADPALRFEPYLVNEDGPFVVPAHVVAIEILHDRSSVLSAAEVSVATLDVSELVTPEHGAEPA